MLLLKIIAAVALLLGPLAGPATRQANSTVAQPTAAASAEQTADATWEPFPQCYPCPK